MSANEVFLFAWDCIYDEQLPSTILMQYRFAKCIFSSWSLWELKLMLVDSIQFQRFVLNCYHYITITLFSPKAVLVAKIQNETAGIKSTWFQIQTFVKGLNSKISENKFGTQSCYQNQIYSPGGSPAGLPIAEIRQPETNDALKLLI